MFSLKRGFKRLFGFYVALWIRELENWFFHVKKRLYAHTETNKFRSKLSILNFFWKTILQKKFQLIKNLVFFNRGEPQFPGLRLPNPVLQILMEDPLAEENEAKIEEVRNHLLKVASMVEGLLTIDRYDQINQKIEELIGLLF